MNPTVLCPTLVGRDTELASLTAALDATVDGSGTMIFILGEAGVGKSRLAREAAAQARERGLSVLRGRAVHAEIPLPYRPISEALLAYLRGAPEVVDSPPVELEPYLPSLGRIVPNWKRDGDPNSPDSDVILGEGILRLLRTLGGCLVVLEDLHWSDPETLSVLQYMSDHLESEPVAVMATVRDDDPSSALSLSNTLSARRSGHILHLERMTHDAVEQMAQLCLGGARPSVEALNLVTAWSEGLPLLVEELLAHAIGSSALVFNDDRWEALTPLDPVVPLTFADTVSHRLAALDEVAATVVSAAAILGRDFDWRLLPLITGLDEGTVLTALRKAIESQLVVTGTEGRADFRFRHALTRDAILQRLLPPERTSLARRALDTLERDDPALIGDRCELAAQLAETAGEPLRAAELLLRASRRAMVRAALTTAETSLDRSHRLAQSSAALTVSIDEMLIEVLTLAGKMDRMGTVGDDLLTALEMTGASPESRARAYLLLARAAVTGNQWQRADELIGLAWSQSTDWSGDLAARLDVVAAQAAIGDHRPAEAEVLARRALQSAGETHLPEVTCEALEVLGRCARISSLERAEAAFRKAREIAEENDLVVWQIRAMLELGTIDLLSGAPLDRLYAARDMSLRAGALVTACVLDLQIAAGLVLFGETVNSLPVIRRACETARRFHISPLLGMSCTVEAEIHLLHDRMEEAERALGEAARVAGDDPDVAAAIHAERANLYLLAEDRPGARRHLDAAEEIARQTPSISPHPFRGLSVLLRALEDRDAETACTELQESGATVQRVNAGRLHYARAMIHGRAGRTTDAENAFAAGEAALAPMPWYRAMTLRLVAEAAVANGWGRPASWLRAAMPIFEERRQDDVLRACRSLLRRAGAPVPRKGRGEAGVPSDLRSKGITSREMDVLLLLAGGMSNREIAARLYLSPRTVERHIENLRGKLGADARSRLVAFAASRLSLPT